ncbi:MAG: VTT domain-containing protein [Enhydrobacter sp.]|nr:MAG: VTT domain-containing protein [Enhydrobacter sp.]
MSAVRSVGLADTRFQTRRPPAPARSSPFAPGRNVWRVEAARRAAVLIDGAAYFAAVRAAFLAARHSILIVGWDIDSRTRLVGDCEPDDGLPAGFADFLAALVQRRPELRIDLLLWDYSLLYSGERELLPRLSLDWQTPDRIRLCLDDTVPLGSSQHQKMVIVDDTLAFSGGLDLTIRRWDTSDHCADNASRVDPAGHPYRPFHDVQIVVDGPAARALAELARDRWCRAEGGTPEIAPRGDPWPAVVVPDFTDVEIGIARTQPHYGTLERVREVEALFVDSIDRAERSIYIENQFLSSPLIARRLARRLRRKPKLEVVIVAPRSHDSWVERRTMRNGRIRFWRRLRSAAQDRVRLLYPSVAQNGTTTDTMIHSKVMIVDDRFLRIGSANLNNRSLGADTECDLAIEAHDAGQRAAIAAIRNRLLGEHCGVTEDDVARALESHGSVVRAADSLAANGHRLLPIDDGKPDRTRLAGLVERIADPMRPLRLKRVLTGIVRPSPTVLAVAGLLVAIVGVTLAWRHTGLAEIADPKRLAAMLTAARDEPWAPLLALGLFVVGGAVALPLNIMVLAAAAAFGPWLGLLYSTVGAALSSVLMYFVGARFGQDALIRVLGQRARRALDSVKRRGVLAVAAVRVVPAAPFTVVNLAIGAGGIGFVDFAVGSLIGLAPGLLLLSIIGDRVMALIEDPSAGEIALLALALLFYLGLVFGAQALLSRRRRGRR